MQRKRGELIPIGEATADLPSAVQALREAPPQARRGFTVADQVNLLVEASEADPDRGFMARLLALCSLPAPTPATGIGMSGATAPTSSSCRPPGITSSPSGTSPDY